MEWRKERLKVKRKAARTSGSTNPDYLRKSQQDPKIKSKISTQYNFIPLPVMFEKIDKKPTALGSNDRGSKNQDKRKPGEIWVSVVQLKPLEEERKFESTCALALW